MNPEKLDFIKNDFPAMIKKPKGDEIPEWGKMNPQQMIEHMTDSIRIADEKITHAVHTPLEDLPAYKGFMMSEKPFRPNTKNKLMDENPPAITNSTLQDAVQELEDEIDYFVNYFEQQPGRVTSNPIFGDLNYGEWVHLLHKHMVHHLKQFRLMQS